MGPCLLESLVIIKALKTKLILILLYLQFQVHFFLKRKDSNLSDAEVSRLNSWALGLRVLSALPLPWQQRCSALHEHPQLIFEVLLMRKQLQSASLVCLCTNLHVFLLNCCLFFPVFYGVILEIMLVIIVYHFVHISLRCITEEI